MLREQARGDEAEALRQRTLIPLATSLRRPDETEAEFSARLEATMAAENERVANATVLAELLVPLLRPDSRGAPAPAAGLAPARAEIRPARAAPPATPRPAATITDFLDEMIAQETAAPTADAAARRRLS